ncbi:hypothetical protein INT45_001172 [Circinella minor]|uniref:SEC7 domain-containing protein n=1 Tax=Circinella minor TaxID=1195481 RepID=A0A8H7VJY0_9FUNG|nr:hypothetical protein INT45_001172 [Circinella minor]
MTTPKRNQSLLQRSWSFPNASPECDNTRERSNTKYVLPPLRSSSLSTDFIQTITTETTTSPLLPLLTDQNNNVQDLVNDEEASSLLEWKRQSVLLRTSVVIPGLSDNGKEREREGKEEEENDDNDECQDIADKLWKGDLVSEASFLGNVDPFSQCTLELYLAKYDFKDMQLDTAFRKLCQKVYFKAEAQEIDRVLEAFARRYWACNNNVVYGSADVIYAIIYSLMLLNTDLHIAKGHTKMSRLTFCRNTMETIYKFVPKETFIKYEYEIEILLK